MKNKIILIFDENCEVSGFQRAYVFCNELDAENFFMSYDAFKEIRIRPNEGWFSFRLTGWNGTGNCFWASDKC